MRVFVCVVQKRKVELALKDMESRAASDREKAERDSKKKQEEISKRQKELITMKIRNIGKEALKVEC